MPRRGRSVQPWAGAQGLSAAHAQEERRQGLQQAGLRLRLTSGSSTASSCAGKEGGQVTDHVRSGQITRERYRKMHGCQPCAPQVQGCYAVAPHAWSSWGMVMHGHPAWSSTWGMVWLLSIASEVPAGPNMLKEETWGLYSTAVGTHAEWPAPVPVRSQLCYMPVSPPYAHLLPPPARWYEASSPSRLLLSAPQLARASSSSEVGRFLWRAWQAVGRSVRWLVG